MPLCERSPFDAAVFFGAGSAGKGLRHEIEVRFGLTYVLFTVRDVVAVRSVTISTTDLGAAMASGGIGALIEARLSSIPGGGAAASAAGRSVVRRRSAPAAPAATAAAAKAAAGAAPADAPAAAATAAATPGGDVAAPVPHPAPAGSGDIVQQISASGNVRWRLSNVRRARALR